MAYRRSEEDGKAIVDELLQYHKDNPGYDADPDDPDDPLNKIIKDHTDPDYQEEEK
jgi:hypothetical protein